MHTQNPNTPISSAMNRLKALHTEWMHLDVICRPEEVIQAETGRLSSTVFFGESAGGLRCKVGRGAGSALQDCLKVE
jgi:hypothetical protein